MSASSTPAQHDRLIQGIHFRCHIFSSLGVTDLKVGFGKLTSPPSRDSVVYFIQETPSDNGFYSPFPDNYQQNLSLHSNLLSRYTPSSNLILTQPECIQHATACVQIANCNRTVIERRDPPRAFSSCRKFYMNAIYITNDDSAIKILQTVLRHPDRITFFSTDDGRSGLVPERILMIVAEAFAGLSMVCMHDGDWKGSVSFAVAALCKHSCALPFVNCVRIVAEGFGDKEAVLALTEYAILPFLRRTDMTAIFDDELKIWCGFVGPSFSDEVVKIAKNIFTQTLTKEPWVIRGKLVGGVFVEKKCGKCGNKEGGLMRCARCCKMYYCSVECQQSDYRDHRASCMVAAGGDGK